MLLLLVALPFVLINLGSGPRPLLNEFSKGERSIIEDPDRVDVFRIATDYHTDVKEGETPSATVLASHAMGEPLRSKLIATLKQALWQPNSTSDETPPYGVRFRFIRGPLHVDVDFCITEGMIGIRSNTKSYRLDLIVSNVYAELSEIAKASFPKDKLLRQGQDVDPEKI